MGFEDLAAIMPEGWKTKAKELGALQRVREIKTPEDLLKLIWTLPLRVDSIKQLHLS
jgi:hypothetical protein